MVKFLAFFIIGLRGYVTHAQGDWVDKTIASDYLRYLFDAFTIDAGTSAILLLAFVYNDIQRRWNIDWLHGLGVLAVLMGNLLAMYWAYTYSNMF